MSTLEWAPPGRVTTQALLPCGCIYATLTTDTRVVLDIVVPCRAHLRRILAEIPE